MPSGGKNSKVINLGGSGGGGASIAEDMYFSTTAERDTFTSNKPERIKQGVTCAVTNGPNYDYYQWDDSSSTWRDANLIFQGRKGATGQEGATGSDGNPNEGFVLDAGASIGMTDAEGNADTIISYDNNDFVIGDTSNEKRTVIKSTDKLYVNITNSEGVNATLRVLDDLDLVNIDGFQTTNIQTGKGLDTVDNNDGSVTLEVTGKQDVGDIDVAIAASVTLDSGYTGKFVNIIQTGAPIAIPMIITLSDHAQFDTGDTISIGTDASYKNYFYAVYYNDSQGANLVAYPSRLQSIRLVRTNGGWDVSIDGNSNKVAVRPKAKAGIPFADNDPDVRPVQAFSFIDNPAVGYIEDEAGNRAIEIDLNKVIDGSTFTTPEEVALLIEENNDEIITPKQGTQFQLIDSDKSSGYGNEGSITYYGVSYSTGQAVNLINKLANSKSYFVHKETSSKNGFAILHQSYVSQIYNQDVTGVSELTMLFGPSSRGRYGKNNQVTPAGMVLNWNGDYIPDTEDPNDLNPSSWIDLSGNATQDWSATGIKTACYSSGLLVNDGSALLQRGDVFCHDNAGVKTSTFTADSASEFFVIPIKVGGGTLSDLKLFPLFMSRLYKTQNEWDSYTFDNSADCVGAILKIAYDAAIESAGDSEKLVAAIAENNLVQADLQTRFGAGTLEINNLEFTVDLITANNLNGEA